MLIKPKEQQQARQFRWVFKQISAEFWYGFLSVMKVVYIAIWLDRGFFNEMF